MSAARKPTLNQQQIGSGLQLTVVFLFLIFIIVSNVSIADDSTSASNIPTSDMQNAAAQETIVEENQNDTALKKELSEERIRGKVIRAIFTSQISDREPTDNLTEISNSSDRIYFFTDLRELEGQIITHRWEHNNKVMAEVKFKVGGGPRWRVYSSKNLLPEWTGVWTVVVTDENGRTLETSVFNYIQAAETVETDAMPDAPVSQ